MESDVLQKRVAKTASEAVGVAKGVVDKARDVAEQAITKENAELLKQDVVKQANAAKEFVKKAFAKENAEHASRVVCEGVDKLRTAEGREEAKAKMVARASVAKSRIVGIWNSGTKGKCILIAASVLILLVLKSYLFSGKTEGVTSADDGSVGQSVSDKYIERCQYCFHEKISGTWEQPPPCRKGHGHSYELIGTIGEKRFGCSKCGKQYPLQYRPAGYVHCPMGQACQWQEL